PQARSLTYGPSAFHSPGRPAGASASRACSAVRGVAVPSWRWFVVEFCTCVGRLSRAAQRNPASSPDFLTFARAVFDSARSRADQIGRETDEQSVLHDPGAGAQSHG